MRIKSPLSNLSDTINQVKDSAAQYRDTLQRNEAATRAVLIDPILHALGWDTANTYMVEVEKSFEQTRVDYALYDNNAKVRIVVEAKALGSNLDDRSITINLFKYALTYATQDFFLTDGLIWKHITNFQPNNNDARIVDFGQDDPIDCAAYLVQHLDAAKFWPEEQTIDVLAQRLAQLESTITTLQREVSQLKVPQTTHFTPAESLSRTTGHTPALSTNDTHLFIDLDSVGYITNTNPSLLRLPDGSVLKISKWKDVLVECCKFALRNNENINLPFPDRSGRKVRLFDLVRPPLGISSVQEEYKDQSIYIYTNYDSNNSVANAIHILNQVPESARKMKAGVVYTKK